MNSITKKIIKKTKNGSIRIAGLIKPLAKPILIPPKIGWKAAKFGAKVAVNGAKVVASPIQKIFAQEKVITELKTQDIKKMMLVSSRKIVSHQEEINKINVWPVADKDTGYNLAATLLGIEGVINQREYGSILELTRDIKEGAMVNARGNAGMIFTGYLIRFLEQIKSLDKVDSIKLSIAMRKGTKAAYRSIFNPVEGTILDVMKAAGEQAYKLVKIKKEKNIVKILEEAQKESKIALEKTKEKLEVLKQNDVVDAGALGFVKILEAWLESLKGTNQLPEVDELRSSSPFANARVREVAEPVISESKTAGKLEYQYDLVFQFRKIKTAELEKLKKELGLLGNSIDILESEDRIKIHIHSNFPEKIKEKIVNFGISGWKAEDMAEQIRKISEKKPLGLVVEEVADLPKEFLEKNGIIEIPFPTRFPDAAPKGRASPSFTGRGEILKKENLFKKLEEERVKTGRPLPIISAPSFKDFLLAYQRALDRFEEILVITLSSKLSGAYSSARIARSMVKEKKRISVFDCFSAEAGEGLTVFKIQELVSQGKEKQEILEILKSFCPQIKVFGGLKDFTYLVRSGRFYLPKIAAKIISLFSKMGIWFLFGVEKGKIRFFGIRFGKDLTKILAREIEKEQKGKEVNIAIAYGNNLKEALELKKELEKKEKIKVLFVSQVSSAVGVYTGPQVLIVGMSPV